MASVSFVDGQVMTAPVPVPIRFAATLLGLRETGMGYWVVNVRTRDDRVTKRVVIDSGYFVSAERSREIPFDPEEVVAIEVTHDKSAILKS